MRGVYIFKKNQYPEGLINRVVKSYLDKVYNFDNSTPPQICLGHKEEQAWRTDVVDGCVDRKLLLVGAMLA